MITLEICYNTNNLDFKETNEAICAVLERQPDDSGTALQSGARDMEFKYESVDAARAAMNLVRNLGFGSKLKVHLREG